MLLCWRCFCEIGGDCVSVFGGYCVEVTGGDGNDTWLCWFILVVAGVLRIGVGWMVCCDCVMGFMPGGGVLLVSISCLEEVGV